MKRRLGVLIMLCFVSLLIVAAKNRTTAQAPAKLAYENEKLAIGKLKNQNLVDGCGCEFHFPAESRKRSSRAVFSEDSEAQKSWMNINGQDIEMKMVHSSEPKGAERVGSHSARTYAGPGIKVTAAYIASWMCPPRDENCEITRYTGTFTVTKDGRRRTVVLKGECGC